MERGNLRFCTAGCGGTVGRRECAWLIVADGRFVFVCLSDDYTREERSFCAEAYFSNAHSIIAVQRAFRLRFAVPPRGSVPGRRSIVNWVTSLRTAGNLSCVRRGPREGLQHHKTPRELEQQYCNLRNALIGTPNGA